MENINRIVFKFGTNVLRGSDGCISDERVDSFINEIAKLYKAGKEILIVTSGAVGLGAKRLGVCDFDDIGLKQACAAVGQCQLMCIYEGGFAKHDINTAQILLTEDDFSYRKKYLSLNNTLHKLLEYRCIPIINQNDTVSTDELENICDEHTQVCFSDNDKLSALVASELGADLLVILSDIDGLYDSNPKENPDAKIIPYVETVTKEIEALGAGASKGGRGGMKTKLEAAKVVTRSGCTLIIANGKKPGIIKEIFETGGGTIFAPSEALSGKKRWIAYATNVKGKIVINEGAKKAIVQKESSLLPIGVTQIIGDFIRGEVISVVDAEGNEIARGMINYNCRDCKKIMGEHSDKILEILGYKNYDAIITRDNMVIL